MSQSEKASHMSDPDQYLVSYLTTLTGEQFICGPLTEAD